MVGRKRKLTVGAQASRRVSRKVKQGQGAASAPQYRNEGTQTCWAEPKSYLDTLPAEILQDIFKYSREPSLIHTSSRLHNILPSYTFWTRRLAGMALIGVPTPGDEHAWYYADEFQEDPMITIANRAFALPGLRAPLPEDIRDNLQREVLQSKWFNLKNFEATYSGIFMSVIHHFFFEGNRFRLSPGQQKRVKKLFTDPDGFNGLDRMNGFTLRIPTDFGHMLSIELRENSIQLLHRGRLLLADCSILRMGYVPDCVFGPGSSAKRSSAIDIAVASSPYNTIQDRSYYKSEMVQQWSRPALENAMRTSISRCCTGPDPIDDENEYNYFASLHELNRLSVIWDKAPTVVDLDMLKAAMHSCDPSCLQEMLESIQYAKPEECGISTDELIFLLDEVPMDQAYAGFIRAVVDAVGRRRHMEKLREQSDRSREESARWARERAERLQRRADELGQTIQHYDDIYTPSNQTSGSG